MKRIAFAALVVAIVLAASVAFAEPPIVGRQPESAFGQRGTLAARGLRPKAAVLVAQSRVRSGSISFSDFGMIDFPRANACTANAINNKGKIVGGYGGSDVLGLSDHGFLLQKGTFKTVDYPMAARTEVSGINDHNVLVGYYQDASGNGHGFMRSGTTYTSIDAPGGVTPYGTIVWDINNAGEIVGGYWDGTRAHGFLLSGGVYTTLDPPGSTSTTATSINNSGEIVGWYAAASDVWHGWILSGGTYSTIDYPGKSSNFLYGINDKDQIVGGYDLQGGFIYQGGTFTDIVVSLDPSARVVPSRLNDEGAMIGDYINNAGTIYGYNVTVGP